MLSLKNNYLNKLKFAYEALPKKTQISLLALLTILMGSIYLGYQLPIQHLKLFDSLKTPHNKDFLQAFYQLVALYLAEFFLRWPFQYFSHLGLNAWLMSLRQKSFSLWLSTQEVTGTAEHLEKHEEETLGETLARVILDGDALKELASSGALSIIVDIVFLLSSFMSFTQLSFRYASFLIIVQAIALLILVRMTKMMGKLFLEVRHQMGYLSRVQSNLVQGMRDLYYSPSFGYGCQKMSKSCDDFFSSQMKVVFWDAFLYSFAESLFPLFIGLLVFYVGHGINADTAISAALLATCFDLIQRSIRPLKEFTSKLSSLQRAYVSWRRIQHFFTKMRSRPRKTKTEGLIIPFSSLRLNVGHFQYKESAIRESSFAIKNIDLLLEPKKMYGLVGLSGHGKSTLMKMLAGDIRSPNVHITYDYRDHACERLSLPGDQKNYLLYQQQIGLVNQEAHLFTETLRFNITLGDLSHSQAFEDFWSQVVNRIPYLQEQGWNPEGLISPKELSLGQQQLLMGLRAAYHQRPLILLDEIASSLDSSLEESLSQLLRWAQEESTIFIVAHRLETLKKAHHIFVIHEGEILEEGTHDELCKRCLLYKTFLESLHQD
jgi:ATP-binding cassette subfamily B multidrug efflux pump